MSFNNKNSNAQASGSQQQQCSEYNFIQNAASSSEDVCSGMVDMLVQSGLNTSALHRELLNLVASHKTKLSEIVPFLIFFKYIKPLVVEACKAIDAQTVLNNAGDRDRQELERELNNLVEYTNTVSSLPAFNMAGCRLIVEQFVKVFETGIISLPGGGAPFHVSLLRLVLGEANQELVSDYINAVMAAATEPTVIPEYMFVSEIVMNNVSRVYDDVPMDNRQSGNDFIQNVLSVMQNGAAGGSDDPSTMMMSFIQRICSTVDIITSALQSDELDHELLMRGVLVIAFPFVKIAAASSPQDAVLYDFYKSMMETDVLAITAEQWVEIRARLMAKSPLFRTIMLRGGMDYINVFKSLKKEKSM
jgi:hypothetical protein